MKKIQVLGPGCASCEGLVADVRTVIEELELECQVEKVTDINQIISYGVMLTPALVVDGEVRVSGRRPAMEELRGMLE